MPRRLSRSSHRLRVRHARSGDLDALVALEQRVFSTDRMTRQGLRRLLSSPSARVFVADAAGALAGAAVVLFRAGTSVARLYSIAVIPSMSGRGVATALLAAGERAAVRRGCRLMRLEVHATNAAAIARYRKSGYRQVGGSAGYYEDGGDALRFEKALPAWRRRERR
ncbi:MAG: GNAT family N-acetyltransferase [Hyphomicrobiales bacterium]|nr:GNAT family N-acetyltransferase [Hyphomicrobiales bacterium]